MNSRTSRLVKTEIKRILSRKIHKYKYTSKEKRTRLTIPIEKPIPKNNTSPLGQNNLFSPPPNLICCRNHSKISLHSERKIPQFRHFLIKKKRKTISKKYFTSKQTRISILPEPTLHDKGEENGNSRSFSSWKGLSSAE